MPDESKDNQKTLKGGINYYTYIWRTEPGACDTCEELDGEEYTSVDDIPNKPHPNCKCYIDVIENNEDEEDDNGEENNTDYEYSENENSTYDDESDDDRKEYYDLTDEAIGDCDSLIDEIQTAIDEFKNQFSDNYFENVKDKIEENIEQLRDYLNELFNISYLLKDMYFNIQEIELKEIKNKLNEFNARMNFIKDITQQIYTNKIQVGLRNKMKGSLTGGASSLFMSPINKVKDDNQYMTPIKEMYKRRRGYSEIWEGDKNFKSAMVRMFGAEGEYSNHKNDKGGETMYGVTKDTLSDYKKKHPEFKNVNINNITKEQASRIYYDEYWKKSGADKIKDKNLAYVHFDATVNHGIGNSRKFLEQSGGDFDKYIEIRRKFYNDIIKNKPSQNVFYKGWINRLDEIQKNKGNY